MNFMKIQKMVWFFMLIMIIVAGLAIEGVAHDWTSPEQAHAVKNPIEIDEKSISKGKVAYLDNCAACHGANIEGLDAESAGLETSPPNLKMRLKMHNDGDFFWKVQEGRGDMPSFKEDLSDSEIWDVINYIKNESKQ